jgi:glutaredoxin-related protein
MKYLLEREGSMEYEIVDIFDSLDEIKTWVENRHNIKFSEFKEEYPDCDIDEWYDENGFRVREIKNNR